MCAQILMTKPHVCMLSFNNSEQKPDYVVGEYNSHSGQPLTIDCETLSWM